jgi:hypothetical protein
MSLEAGRWLDGPLGFAENQVLAVRALPLGLAGDTSGRVRQGGEPLVSDLATTVLADPEGALGLAVAGVCRLLTILLEDLADGLGVRALALNLCEVGFPEAFAHKNQYPPEAARSNVRAFRSARAGRYLR